VDDPLAVGVGQPPHDANRRDPVEHALVQPVLQRLAADEVAGDEQLVAIFARVEDGHDVGMPQVGRRLGLAQEALAAFLPLGLVGLLDLGHLRATARFSWGSYAS